MQAQAMSLEPGIWEGEYIDARGHRGQLRLTLEASEGRVRGKYELTLRTEDRPQVLTGEVDGDVDGGRVRLAVALGARRERVEHEAELQSAGSHATQAMMGIVRAAPQSDFGGGVWIAWRFGRQPAGR